MCLLACRSDVADIVFADTDLPVRTTPLFNMATATVTLGGTAAETTVGKIGVRSISLLSQLMVYTSSLMISGLVWI